MRASRGRSSEDHPRSRGVYMIMNAAVPAWVGSSPLARGLLDPPLRASSSRRIIPARAGFTSPHPVLPLLRADHPRSRGVYRPSAPLTGSPGGSSPLARGLHGLVEGQSLADGIIPARAGFTRWTVMPAGSRSDHPRSRGVYCTSRSTSTTEPGSSPLARGLPDGSPFGRVVGGIIPARAGFTRAALAGRDLMWDHPRSRGVHVIVDYYRSQEQGSSPLARGLRHILVCGSKWGWIIPARAGFTGLLGARPPEPEDHPRSRGVYYSPLPLTRVRYGSSPLARGLPPTAGTTSSGPGIIPARAGFTPRAWPAPGPGWDHPRSRGVYSP